MTDNADLIAVIKGCFPPECVVNITGDDATSNILTFQFLDNGAHVGTCVCCPRGNTLVGASLDLAPDYQNQGIFTALCAAIPEYCRTHGIETMRIPVATGPIMPGLLVDVGFTPEELGGWISTDVSEGGAVEQYGLS